MSTSFLEALKAKRTLPGAIEQRVSDLAKKSAESVKHVINPSPSIPLSSLIPNQVSDNPDVINGVQTFATPLSSTKPTLIIERVLNRKRLDLFFSSKPDADTLESLHNCGWCYRGTDKAWYHVDTERNRHYLKRKFNISVSEDSDHIADDAVTVNEPESKDSPEFAEFKRKVNILVEHLNVSPADLMILAIDALFEKQGRALN